MKTTAVLLAVLMASPSMSEAQSRESFTAAAVRIGGRMAATAPPSSQFWRKDKWQHVLSLKEGSRVRVTTADGALTEGLLGAAMDERIVLVSAAALPEEARKLLLDVAQNNPGYIGHQPHFVHKQLKVDDSGIFFDGTRVGDTKSVIIAIERDAVTEIQRPVGGSLVGGLLGGTAGAALGLLSAWNLIWWRCDGDCGGRGALMALSLVGMPIAGGYLGAKAFPHPKWATVYRRR